MKNQSLLVILLLMIVASMSHTLQTDNDDKIDDKENEIVQDKLKVDPKIPKALDPRFNKMLPLAVMRPEMPQKLKKPTTTEKPVKDETSTIGNEAKAKKEAWKRVINFFLIAAFVAYKDEKLESEMLKDVSHADVAKNDEKNDETIDDTDPNYDDYYDVSLQSTLQC